MVMPCMDMQVCACAHTMSGIQALNATMLASHTSRIFLTSVAHSSWCYCCRLGAYLHVEVVVLQLRQGVLMRDVVAQLRRLLLQAGLCRTLRQAHAVDQQLNAATAPVATLQQSMLAQLV